MESDLYESERACTTIVAYEFNRFDAASRSAGPTRTTT